MNNSKQTIEERTNKAIASSKNLFLFFVEQFGIDGARARIKKETIFHEVLSFAANYRLPVKAITLDNPWMNLHVTVDHLRYKVVAIVDTVEEANNYGDDVGIICSDNDGHHFIAELKPS